MPSSKIRELEDNLIFKQMTTAAADKTDVDFLSKPDRVTSKDVHNMLMAAGFTPGLGNIADAADALLYTAEGEFGSAALSAAAMIPFVGQTVSAKKALKVAKESGEKMRTLYRGTIGDGKSLVKEGKFWNRDPLTDDQISRINEVISADNLPVKKGTHGTWVTSKFDEALGYSNPWKEKGIKNIVLEFEVPESFLKKGAIQTGFDTGGQLGDAFLFTKGLPEEFLIKVHK